MTTKVIRALGFAAMGGLSALGLNRLNYEQHLKNIVFPEQTNTINILANSLPARLSDLLISQNKDEINNMLNISTNISLVVTDCRQASGDCDTQDILFSSEDFQSSIDAQILSMQPFSVLRDPPPLYPEWKFTGQNDTVQTSLSKRNQGQPIGRVYYLRNSPPSFWADLAQRFTISSADDLLDAYVLTWMLSLGTSILIWSLFEVALRNRKQAAIAVSSVDLKIREVKAHFTDLLSEKDSRLTRTQSQLMQLEREHKTLITQNDRLKLDVRKLENEQTNLQEKLQVLDADILQSISQQDQAEIADKSFKETISSLKAQLSEAQKRASLFYTEGNELRAMIAKYSSQISNSSQTLTSTDLELDALRQSQLELQKKLTNREHSLAREQQATEELRGEIANLESRLELSQSQLEETTQQVQDKERLATDLQDKFGEIKQDYQDLRGENTQLIQYGDELTHEVDDLKTEIDEYLQTIRGLKLDLLVNSQRIKTLETKEQTQSSQTLDLSLYRIAILCGHDDEVQDICAAMSEKYGKCNIKIISQEDAEHLPERRLKPQLASMDFVLLLTRRASHSVTGNVKSICKKLQIQCIPITDPGDGDSHLQVIVDKLNPYFGC